MTDLPSLPAAQSVVEQTVVVRADRLARPPGGTGVVLTPDLIARSVPLRIDALINQEAPSAGLFRRQDSAGANATIQGLSLRPLGPNGASRAAVTIDGVPQNDPFGGWVYWGRHDGLFLERVDVLAGAAGVGGGTGALTGTVDLSEQRGVFTRLRASAGQAGSASIAVATGRRLGDGQVAVSLGHDRSDGQIAVPVRQRGPVDEAVAHRFTSATLAADVTASATASVGARLSLFGEDKTSGLLGGASSAGGGDASLALRLEGRSVDARLLAWMQVRDFANRLTTANAARTATSATLDQFATPATQTGGSLLLQQHDGPHSLLLEATRSDGQTRELFRNQGAGFTRDRQAGGRQDVVSAVLARAPHSGGEPVWWSWTVRADHWANREGVRIERDLATGTVVLDAPPADSDGLAWHGAVRLGHRASGLSLGLYQSSRLPTLNELHRPFRVGNDATDANGALVPETLTGVDLGWQGSGRAGLLDWRASGTAWLNRLDDPVVNVTRGTGPGTFGRIGFLPAGGAYRVRENAGAIEAAGLDLSARVQLAGAGERPALGVSLGLTDANVVSGEADGLRPAQSPRVASSLALDLPLGMDPNGAGVAPFALRLSARHEGDRFEDDLNSRTLPAFTALDARIAWRWRDGIELFASGENLTDTTVEARREGDGLIALTGQRQWRVGFLVTR